MHCPRLLNWKFPLLSFGCLGIFLTQINQVQAQQVSADGTLNSIVTRSGNDFTVTGGTTAGTNLFHSFREFSIPTGGTAFFDNATTVQNIFSRVTGGTVSSIDGLIRANGTANLFLLNPSGILFGANASLNIGGSFVGTTAQSIKFADGMEFSATNLGDRPLLTMSVPIGLQMGINPGSIKVQGGGHQLKTPNASTSFYSGSYASGLQVSPGNTLALLGGDVRLNGGTLAAPSGRIELGAVETGQVALKPTSQGFSFDYQGISNFRSVQLSQKAIIDGSGAPSSSVQIQGRQVILRDGSVVWLQNRGTTQGGDLDVRATERVELNGFTPNGTARDTASAFYIEAMGLGAGGNLRITTPQLILSNGGTIEYKNFSVLPAGNVQINATEFLRAEGFFNAARLTLLYSSTHNEGQGADIVITTPRLEIRNGAQIAAPTYQRGRGGNNTINANTVLVEGVSPTTNSALATSSLGSGNAGKLTVNTHTLTIKDSGIVASSGFGNGNTGSVSVNASESVTISGARPGYARPSQIGSTIATPFGLFRQLFNLPAVPSGAVGGVQINTPSLAVTDRARITLRNEGIGDGGTLSINADMIRLSDAGSLTAATILGSGGNIALNSQALIMRRGSNITASASGTIGSGGKITIDAPIILGLENSDIIANAVQGRGGNVAITTQGIFGLKYRDRLTPENDITASSDFGVSGTVQINTIDVDPNAGLVELSESLADDSQQVAQGCSTTQGSSFVITGRGGVPQNPSEQAYLKQLWRDLRALALNPTAPPIAVLPITPWPEASAWYQHPQTGVVELIATSPVQPRTTVNCAGVLK